MKEYQIWTEDAVNFANLALGFTTFDRRIESEQVLGIPQK